MGWGGQPGAGRLVTWDYQGLPRLPSVTWNEQSLQQNVRKSIKSDLKGSIKIILKIRSARNVRMVFIVHPGPPKTLPNPLNQFILHGLGQKPENIQKSPYGGGSVPYWALLTLCDVPLSCPICDALGSPATLSELLLDRPKPGRQGQ